MDNFLLEIRSQIGVTAVPGIDMDEETTKKKGGSTLPFTYLHPNEVQEVTKSFKMKLKGRLEAFTAVGLIPSSTGDASDAFIVSGREDKIILVSNFEDGQEVCKLMEGHYEAISSMATITRSDGQSFVISGGLDGSTVVWNMKQMKSEKKLIGGPCAITAVIAFEVNGPPPQAASKTSSVQTSSKSSAAADKWTCIITAANNGVATMWNMENGGKVAISEMEGESTFNSLAYFYKPGSPSPFWITGGAETIAIWNMLGYITHSLPESAKSMRVCYTSKAPNQEKGPVLVWVNAVGTSIAVMDLITDKIITRIDNNGDPYGCMELMECSSGYRIFVSSHADILVFDMITGNQYSDISFEDGHTDTILDMRLCTWQGTSYLLTGSDDNSMCVWLPTSEATYFTSPIKTICGSSTDGHTGLVTAVATCNTEIDGEMVIITASSDLSAIVWGMDTGTQIRKLQNGHTRKILSAVCFEPKQGKPSVFTAGADMTIIKWDLSSGDILARITDLHQDVIRSITVYSFDGVNPISVSVGEDFSVGFYDWTHKVREVLNDVHMAIINSVDSMVTIIDDVETAVVITGSEDKTARIIRNGVLNATSLTGHASPVIAASLLDVDTYQKLAITASDDAYIMVWDIFTSSILRKLKSHQDGITSMSCYCQLGAEPAGVTGDDERPNSPKKKVPRRKYPCLATGSNDKTACIWDLVTGKRIRVFEGGHSREVSSVSVMVTKKTGVITLITAGYDNSATIWDLENCERAIPLEGQGHLENIVSTSLVSSPANSCYYNIAADCNTIRVWDLVNHAGLEKEYCRINIRQPGAHSEGLLTMITYMDTATLADSRKRYPLIFSSSEDGTVIKWDMENKTILHFEKPAKCPSATINSLCICDDANKGHPVLIGAGEEKEILVWNIKTGKIMKEFPESHSKIITLVLVCKFQESGIVIVTGGKDKTLASWSYDKKSVIHKFTDQHKKAISCGILYKPSAKVAHSDDVYWLISCSYDRKCCVWDVKTGKYIKLMYVQNAHKESVESITTIDTAPDRSRPILITGGADGVIALWDLYEGNLLHSVTQHAGSVSALSLSSRLLPPRVTPNGNAAAYSTRMTIAGGSSIVGDADGQFMKDVFLSSGGSDCNINVWNLENILNSFAGAWSTAPVKLRNSFQGCRRFGCSEMSVYVPIDGSDPIIVCVGDKTLRTTNFNSTKQLTAPVELIPKRLTAVCPVSRGKPQALVGNTNGTVEMWNIKDFTIEKSYNILTALNIAKTAVLAVNAYSSIQREAYYGLAGLENKTAHLWNFVTNEPICTLVGHKAPVRAVKMIADHTHTMGRVFAVTSGDDRMAIVWELPVGKRLFKLKDAHSKSVTSLSVFHNKEG
jgi:WD40 repeat protein